MNLINNQPDIDKIYLYAKDPYEAKHQYLINKREKVGLDPKDPKAFMEYSNDMEDVYKPIDFNDLAYNFKDSKIATVGFIKFKCLLHIFKIYIYNGYMPLEDIEKEPKELKGGLGRIKQRDPRDKSEEQKKTKDNIKNLHNSREEVVKMFNDYARNMSRNIYDSKQEGTGLKILTPKQMLQRLPISLAPIKAGNNSQSLLNEIRQIVYSLCQSKEIIKNVYNNILNQ